jgi:ArsR family transcriptional regulator, arsenate/arsenite/antimonite-responsive transcriptional repressor
VRKLAEFHGVLADEARLRILWLLMNSGELCVCEVMSILGFSQSKASRHLRILHAAGLLAHRRQGLWIHYSVAGVGDTLVMQQLQILKKQMAASSEAQSILEKVRPALCCRARCYHQPARQEELK